MGNKDRRTMKNGAIFRQSISDFPCPVTLGKYTPSFGLHRYKQGLRFVPFDNEGFTLRGNSRRLLYKGRRRSHRFTILNDGAFEYDCILEREPESNVVLLLIEGAENFDFFRQPDFVKDPFLKGSYAVYKKQTFIGEGTGKLCHIHRPLIIDVQGRRVWGELAVVGNILYITIPEKWLAEAKYPVIVDPTIGTTTVGSQTMIDPPDQFYFESSIPVNRFLVSEAINGLCTAYIYTDHNDDDAGGYPVLYTDNGNKPLTLCSKDEEFADLRIDGSKPKGWRTAGFKSKNNIVAGSYIWFGVMVYFLYPRFDYGAKCYCDFLEDDSGIPVTYPIYNVNWYEDYKVSMYFTYTSAQNYIRTLTQGVKLSDNRKLTGNYKRIATNYVKATTIINKLLTISRKIMEVIGFIDKNTFFVLFVRKNRENIPVIDKRFHLGTFLRGINEKVKSGGEGHYGWVYFIHILDTVNAVGAVFRGLMLFVRIITKLYIRDYLFRLFLKAQTELMLKSCVVREIVLDSKLN
jgi:hypothetical protein